MRSPCVSGRPWSELAAKWDAKFSNLYELSVLIRLLREKSGYPLEQAPLYFLFTTSFLSLSFLIVMLRLPFPVVPRYCPSDFQLSDYVIKIAFETFCGPVTPSSDDGIRLPSHLFGIRDFNCEPAQTGNNPRFDMSWIHSDICWDIATAIDFPQPAFLTLRLSGSCAFLSLDS